LKFCNSPKIGLFEVCFVSSTLVVVDVVVDVDVGVDVVVGGVVFVDECAVLL